jgi:hypothetical protein
MVHVREAEAGEELTGKLRTVDEALRAHCEEVVSLAACATALRDRGLLPATFLGVFHPKALLEKLVALREHLTTAPQTIFKSNRWATTNQSLKTSAQALREGLLKLWGQYLDDLTPSLPEFRDLIQSDAFGDNFRRIGQLQNEIDALRQTLPASVAAIEAVAAKGEEIKKFAANLDFDKIPVGVNKFLKAVLLRSVTLAELDPAVHAWLVEKKIAGSFRITSARSR